MNLYGFVGNDGINQLDKLGLINWNEVGACAIPGMQACCAQAKTIAERVRDKMKERYGRDVDGGPINAIKHCVWNCMMTQALCCNSAAAKRIADAHEETAKNNPDSKRMDLHNNHKGRVIGLKLGRRTGGRYSECFSECEKAALNTELYWFLKDGVMKSDPGDPEWNDWSMRFHELPPQNPDDGSWNTRRGTISDPMPPLDKPTPPVKPVGIAPKPPMN